MRDDIPDRMVYKGQRWRVTDRPTRVRKSIWTIPRQGSGMYGWRFEASDSTGQSRVFDVIRTECGWQVQHVYD